LKKLIKYEKSRVSKKENVDLKFENRYSAAKEKKVVMPKYNSTKSCCTKKNNDVFERLSHPNSKTKLCSKAVSTVGVQTDLNFTQTSKI